MGLHGFIISFSLITATLAYTTVYEQPQNDLQRRLNRVWVVPNMQTMPNIPNIQPMPQVIQTHHAIPQIMPSVPIDHQRHNDWFLPNIAASIAHMVHENLIQKAQEPNVVGRKGKEPKKKEALSRKTPEKSDEKESREVNKVDGKESDTDDDSISRSGEDKDKDASDADDSASAQTEEDRDSTPKEKSNATKTEPKEDTKSKETEKESPLKNDTEEPNEENEGTTTEAADAEEEEENTKVPESDPEESPDKDDNVQILPEADNHDESEPDNKDDDVEILPEVPNARKRRDLRIEVSLDSNPLDIINGDKSQEVELKIAELKKKTNEDVIPNSPEAILDSKDESHGILPIEPQDTNPVEVSVTIRQAEANKKQTTPSVEAKTTDKDEAKTGEETKDDTAKLPEPMPMTVGTPSVLNHDLIRPRRHVHDMDYQITQTSNSYPYQVHELSRSGQVATVYPATVASHNQPTATVYQAPTHNYFNHEYQEPVKMRSHGYVVPSTAEYVQPINSRSVPAVHTHDANSGYTDVRPRDYQVYAAPTENYRAIRRYPTKRPKYYRNRGHWPKVHRNYAQDEELSRENQRESAKKREYNRDDERNHIEGTFKEKSVDFSPTKDDDSLSKEYDDYEQIEDTFAEKSNDITKTKNSNPQDRILSTATKDQISKQLKNDKDNRAVEEDNDSSEENNNQEKHREIIKKQEDNSKQSDSKVLKKSSDEVNVLEDSPESLEPMEHEKRIRSHHIRARDIHRQIQLNNDHSAPLSNNRHDQNFESANDNDFLMKNKHHTTRYNSPHHNVPGAISDVHSQKHNKPNSHGHYLSTDASDQSFQNSHSYRQNNEHDSKSFEHNIQYRDNKDGNEHIVHKPVNVDKNSHRSDHSQHFEGINHKEIDAENIESRYIPEDYLDDARILEYLRRRRVSPYLRHPRYGYLSRNADDLSNENNHENNKEDPRPENIVHKPSNVLQDTGKNSDSSDHSPHFDGINHKHNDEENVESRNVPDPYPRIREPAKPHTQYNPSLSYTNNMWSEPNGPQKSTPDLLKGKYEKPHNGLLSRDINKSVQSYKNVIPKESLEENIESRYLPDDYLRDPYILEYLRRRRVPPYLRHPHYGYLSRNADDLSNENNHESSTTEHNEHNFTLYTKNKEEARPEDRNIVHRPFNVVQNTEENSDRDHSLPLIGINPKHNDEENVESRNVPDAYPRISANSQYAHSGPHQSSLDSLKGRYEKPHNGLPSRDINQPLNVYIQSESNKDGREQNFETVQSDRNDIPKENIESRYISEDYLRDPYILEYLQRRHVPPYLRHPHYGYLSRNADDLSNENNIENSNKQNVTHYNQNKVKESKTEDKPIYVLEDTERNGDRERNLQFEEINHKSNDEDKVESRNVPIAYPRIPEKNTIPYENHEENIKSRYIPEDYLDDARILEYLRRRRVSPYLQHGYDPLYGYLSRNGNDLSNENNHENNNKNNYTLYNENKEEPKPENDLTHSYNGEDFSRNNVSNVHDIPSAINQISKQLPERENLSTLHRENVTNPKHEDRNTSAEQTRRFNLPHFTQTAHSFKYEYSSNGRDANIGSFDLSFVKNMHDLQNLCLSLEFVRLVCSAMTEVTSLNEMNLVRGKLKRILDADNPLWQPDSVNEPYTNRPAKDNCIKSPDTRTDVLPQNMDLLPNIQNVRPQGQDLPNGDFLPNQTPLDDIRFKQIPVNTPFNLVPEDQNLLPQNVDQLSPQNSVSQKPSIPENTEPFGIPNLPSGNYFPNTVNVPGYHGGEAPTDFNSPNGKVPLLSSDRLPNTFKPGDNYNYPTTNEGHLPPQTFDQNLPNRDPYLPSYDESLPGYNNLPNRHHRPISSFLPDSVNSLLGLKNNSQPSYPKEDDLRLDNPLNTPDSQQLPTKKDWIPEYDSKIPYLPKDYNHNLRPLQWKEPSQENNLQPYEKDFPFSNNIHVPKQSPLENVPYKPQPSSFPNDDVPNEHQNFGPDKESYRYNDQNPLQRPRDDPNDPEQMLGRPIGPEYLRPGQHGYRPSSYYRPNGHLRLPHLGEPGILRPSHHYDERPLRPNNQNMPYRNVRPQENHLPKDFYPLPDQEDLRPSQLYDQSKPFDAFRPQDFDNAPKIPYNLYPDVKIPLPKYDNNQPKDQTMPLTDMELQRLTDDLDEPSNETNIHPKFKPLLDAKCFGMYLLHQNLPRECHKPKPINRLDHATQQGQGATERYQKYDDIPDFDANRPYIPLPRDVKVPFIPYPKEGSEKLPFPADVPVIKNLNNDLRLPNREEPGKNIPYSPYTIPSDGKVPYGEASVDKLPYAPNDNIIPGDSNRVPHWSYPGKPGEILPNFSNTAPSDSGKPMPYYLNNKNEKVPYFSSDSNQLPFLQYPVKPGDALPDLPSTLRDLGNIPILPHRNKDGEILPYFPHGIIPSDLNKVPLVPNPDQPGETWPYRNGNGDMLPYFPHEIIPSDKNRAPLLPHPGKLDETLPYLNGNGDKFPYFPHSIIPDTNRAPLLPYSGKPDETLPYRNENGDDLPYFPYAIIPDELNKSPLRPYPGKKLPYFPHALIPSDSNNPQFSPLPGEMHGQKLPYFSHDDMPNAPNNIPERVNGRPINAILPQTMGNKNEYPIPNNEMEPEAALDSARVPDYRQALQEFNNNLVKLEQNLQTEEAGPVIRAFVYMLKAPENAENLPVYDTVPSEVKNSVAQYGQIYDLSALLPINNRIPLVYETLPSLLNDILPLQKSHVSPSIHSWLSQIPFYRENFVPIFVCDCDKDTLNKRINSGMSYGNRRSFNTATNAPVFERQDRIEIGYPKVQIQSLLTRKKMPSDNNESKYDSKLEVASDSEEKVTESDKTIYVSEIAAESKPTETQIKTEEPLHSEVDELADTTSDELPDDIDDFKNKHAWQTEPQTIEEENASTDDTIINIETSSKSETQKYFKTYDTPTDTPSVTSPKNGSLDVSKTRRRLNFGDDYEYPEFVNDLPIDLNNNNIQDVTDKFLYAVSRRTNPDIKPESEQDSVTITTEASVEVVRDDDKGVNEENSIESDKKPANLTTASTPEVLKTRSSEPNADSSQEINIRSGNSDYYSDESYSSEEYAPVSDETYPRESNYQSGERNSQAHADDRSAESVTDTDNNLTSTDKESIDLSTDTDKQKLSDNDEDKNPKSAITETFPVRDLTEYGTNSDKLDTISDKPVKNPDKLIKKTAAYADFNPKSAIPFSETAYPIDDRSEYDDSPEKTVDNDQESPELTDTNDVNSVEKEKRKEKSNDNFVLDDSTQQSFIENEGKPSKFYSNHPFDEEIKDSNIVMLNLPKKSRKPDDYSSGVTRILPFQKIN